MQQSLFGLADSARRLDGASGGSRESAPYAAAEPGLVRLALELGADRAGGGLSAAESQLIQQALESRAGADRSPDRVREEIRGGGDPLGDAFCQARPALQRRAAGTFYTPPALVEPMIDWVLRRNPVRLVDPGCGSGRFAAAALRRRPDLVVVAVDTDPLATILARANFAVLGAANAIVKQADYTALELPHIEGRTAFVGNPPYIRHHELSAAAKALVIAAAKRAGHRASGLAGLHAHFFVATAHLAQPGDVGCFVTSAEWLDVNYGSVIRELLLGRLGGTSLHMIDPREVPFEDAMTTAVITCFEVGSRPEAPKLRLLGSPPALGTLDEGAGIARSSLTASRRWTPLLRDAGADIGLGAAVPLRTVARVHRGIVTGANVYFLLTREQAHRFGVLDWCRPAITSAKEILTAGGVVHDGPERRLLLDIPRSVDRSAYPALDAYLRSGEHPQEGQDPVCARYIPRHRKPWWYLGPVTAPPVVATYMARQAPVFALNPDGLALINIGHGIYPHEPSRLERLTSLVKVLNERRDAFRGGGRTYHGGLEKFEPREMEALPIPPPADFRVAAVWGGEQKR